MSKESEIKTCEFEGNFFDCDADGYVNFGDVCRNLLHLQAQYGSFYIKGISDYPNIGTNLRFKNLDNSNYHAIMIHKDDIDEFLKRYKKLRTGKVEPKTQIATGGLKAFLSRLLHTYRKQSAQDKLPEHDSSASLDSSEQKTKNNFQSKIETAFLSMDEELCFEILADLDEMLTGNRCSNGQAGGWKRQINEFLSQYANGGEPEQIFYLSDGGFSRLMVYVSLEDRTKIISQPTDNSLSNVKAKWEKVK